MKFPSLYPSGWVGGEACESAYTHVEKNVFDKKTSNLMSWIKKTSDFKCHGKTTSKNVIEKRQVT